MQADLEELVAFHLVGQWPAVGAARALEKVAGAGLRPALMAHYRHLAELRHDYPLVLVSGEVGRRDSSEGGAEAGSDVADVVALSALIDELLSGMTPPLPATGDVERLRHHALRLERAIRRQLAAGAAGSLSGIWESAESRLLAESAGDALLVDSLDRLRAARDRTRTDGALVDCDQELPARLVTHLWRASQRSRARLARRRLGRLRVHLGEILRADDAGSLEGLAPARLRASVGGAFGAEIDFGAVSRLLTTAKPIARLPAARRQRVEGLLAELVAAEALFDDAAIAAALFTDCTAALAAWRRAVPGRVALMKAILAAELEIEGRYHEAAHDALFAGLGAAELGAAVGALLPNPLILTRADGMSPGESAALDEILIGELPIEILLRTDDLAGAPEAPAVAGGAVVRARAHAAIGLGGVFVLQSAASELYRHRDALRRAGGFTGPVLLSVYSGAGGELGDVSPYLASAAAVEARAFPSFVFDPSAGEDWATRFSLAHNPQPEADWPVRPFQYEADALQSVAVDLHFTLADFLACDARWSGSLARVTKENCNRCLMTVPEAVVSDSSGLPERVPTLFLVDAGGTLQRVVVGSRLIHLSRRARDQWRSLQELGGIRNSHVERRLTAERCAWEEEHRESAAVPAAVAAAAPPTSALSPMAADAGPTPPPARHRDEAYIETPRCSTCNECIRINDRMFKYDANRQAFIADLAAGTYAQLVHAAEICQVAIIHPGQPRDPAEPGLDEWLPRAAPFR